MNGSKAEFKTVDVGPQEFFLLTMLLGNKEYVIHVVAYSDSNIQMSAPAEIRARTHENGKTDLDA